MYAKDFHVSIKNLRICANNPALEDFVIIRNFCACTHKSSTSLLRICVYAQIIQCWKTLISKIIMRNFCACTQKSSTSLLRICVYAQKIQQMIIIKSSNNPIVDVLRPAQKLQIWNTYIPGMYLSKFGVSAQGAKHPVLEFLRMCALKSFLSWIICVQRKKSFCTGLEFVRRYAEVY